MNNLKNNINLKKEKIKTILIFSLIIICCILTYYFHTILNVGTVFSHFFYIPIILSSLWWKKKGLWVAFFLSIFFLFSHEFLKEYSNHVNDYLRTIMFIVIGFIVAILSEKISKAKKRINHTNEIEVKHKNIKGTLKDQEQILFQILQGSPIPTFVIDNKHIVTHWNKACYNLTGFSTNEIISTKKHWMAFYPAERPSLADLIVDGESEDKIRGYYKNKCRKSPIIDGAYEAESFFPSLGETGRWLVFTASPLKDMNGKIIGAIEIMRDITERKNAEEKLLLQEQNLRERIKELNCFYGLSSLIEQSGITLDKILQGTVELIPPAWLYSEITCARISLKDSEFRTDNFKETEQKLSSKIKVNGKPFGEIEIYLLEQKPDIDYGPFLREEKKLIDSIAERLGRLIEALQVEEALSKSEKISKALLNVTTESIVMIDRVGKIIDINETGAARFNTTRHNIMGKIYYDFLPKEKIALRKKKINNVTLSKKPIQFQDARDGYIFDINQYPIFDENMKVKNIAIFSRDITQLIELQEEVIAISEYERKKIGQNLHDDLGQHITGINYLLSSVRETMIEKSYPEISEINKISDNVGHVLDRIENILSEVLPIKLEKNEFMIALEEMCIEIERIFKISCKIKSNINLILKNEIKSFHIFYITKEAINNALKHGKAKNILVKIQEKNKQIKITIENDFGEDRYVKTNKKLNDISKNYSSIKDKELNIGMGIKIMKYRASIIGAELNIIENENKFSVILKFTS
jgi:PAS domain S-box-containing protein